MTLKSNPKSKEPESHFKKDRELNSPRKKPRRKKPDKLVPPKSNSKSREPESLFRKERELHSLSVRPKKKR